MSGEPDRQALQEVAQTVQYTLEPVLASMSSIERGVRRYYFGERTTRTRLGEPLSSIPRDIPLAAPRPRSVPNRSAEAAFPDERIEADAPVIGSIEPGAGAQDAIRELKTLIIRLESTVNAQSRAFRALVNLLQHKGVVRRGELGLQASRK